MKILRPKILLPLQDPENLAVLYLLELLRSQAWVMAGIAQFLRPQKAADMVGPIFK